MIRSNTNSHIDVILIQEIFKGKENGFYLEAGANDGITDSISYTFEKYLNWDGILCEPQPELMEKCRRNRSIKNIFLDKGLGDRDELAVMTVPEDNLDNASFNMSEKHLETLKNTGFGKSYRFDIFEIITFDEMVKHYGIDNIDLAIIDVEGYENKVLKSIMKSEVLPEVIVAEYDWSNVKELNRILRKKYNIFKKYDHDIVYIRKK